METSYEITQGVKKEKHGIPGSTLKIIAIVAMLIDHIAAVCLDSYIATVMPTEAYYDSNAALKFLAQYGTVYYGDMAMRLIGRFGFPVFVFLLVEGFMHTSNIKKYIRNLAIFALISEIPFNLAMNATLFCFDYQSVFVTLLIGVLTLSGIKYVSDKTYSEKLSPLFYVAAALFGLMLGGLIYNSDIEGFFSGFGLIIEKMYYYIAGIIIGLLIMIFKAKSLSFEQKMAFTFSVPIIYAGTVFADVLNTDYASWGVFTIVVMYYYRNASYKKRMGMGALALTIMQGIEVTSFLMMIPANMYNGKRGLKLKYFFYAFYPVHLLILYLITLALGYNGFAIR